MYSFPDLEPVCCSMSSSHCCFLISIQISQEAGKVVWYSHLLKNFPVCCDPHSPRLWHSQESRSSCFSGTLSLFQWSQMLAIWSLVPLPFLNHLEHLEVHGSLLLKPDLENFEHYFASMWDKCNCAVVWTFFGVVFLWYWNENWPFPVCGHCCIFQICCRIEHSTVTAPSFKTWNSSTEIPSPLLTLFVVMLPKAHLTSHSKMSGSRWKTTP